MFGNRGGRTSYSAGGFEDLLGGMFGGGGFGASTGGFRRRGGPSKGADVTASTTLDFLTAIRGDTVTLTMQSGSETKVKIPEGVADGQKIRLKGKGEPSPDGGAAGDLVLTVTVRKHPVFEREGLNLRVDVPVTFVEATLGATIEVPTLDGAPVKLRVAAGTPSGPGAARQGPRRHDEQGHRRPAGARRRRGARAPARRREGRARGVRRGDARREPARRAAREGEGAE